MDIDKVDYTETVKDGKRYRVSTVRLVVTHPGGMDYETLVFPGEEWGEVDGRRYESRREAQKGHRKLVAAWSD